VIEGKKRKVHLSYSEAEKKDWEEFLITCTRPEEEGEEKREGTSARFRLTFVGAKKQAGEKGGEFPR